MQHARTEDGRTVSAAILDAIASRNVDATTLGSVGAVVGATIGQTNENLDVNGPLLVPGVGAQGGTVEDVQRIFGVAVRNVLPSSSREILLTGPDKGTLRSAAERAVQGFSALVSA